jgi:hypothetical protein
VSPLGGPGPRDWSPPESGWGSAPPTRPRTTTISPYEPPRRRTRPGWYAALALLLGATAFVVGVTEPNADGVSRGFLVSTIGITAMITGSHAVRVGGQFARAFGRGGAIFGAVGTALMAYALIAYSLAPGVELPSLSIASLRSPSSTMTNPLGVTTADAAPAQAAEPNTSIDRTPTTAPEERSRLASSAGTLSFVLRQRFGAGPYPARLVARPGDPWTVAVDGGAGLAPLPTGARVVYSTSADGTAWNVSIIGAQFGQVATISSAVNTVTLG